MFRILSLIALALATAAVAASVAGADTQSSSRSTAVATVRVLMAPGGNTDLMKISPSVVKAGVVTFVISNQSGGNKKINGIVQGSLITPFVLLKTNVAPSKLPVGSDGRQLEKPRVGRVVVDPGKTATLTLKLKPGKYVVLGSYGALGRVAALKVAG